jgi:hypothetical protein
MSRKKQERKTPKKNRKDIQDKRKGPNYFY